MQLVAATVGIINHGEYGKLIHDCDLRRQMIDVGETIVDRAFGAEPDLHATCSRRITTDAALANTVAAD